MGFSDFHVHSQFSDGRNTAEEVVLAAIGRGLDAIGFSDHSYTPMDAPYSLQPDQAGAYQAEIARLKEKYKDQIEVYCGIEQDLCSEIPPEGYDYVIGSVHWIPAGDGVVAIDYSPERQHEGARKYFGGDYYALAEAYFAAVPEAVERSGADIVGHFDLISKFIEVDPALFDENHPRYIAAWQKAADRLLETGALFEINTGAISRGFRTSPYPAAPILAYLKEHGARFILSSDSHSAENIAYLFDEITEDTVDFREILHGKNA